MKVVTSEEIPVTNNSNEPLKTVFLYCYICGNTHFIRDGDGEIACDACLSIFKRIMTSEVLLPTPDNVYFSRYLRK